MDPLDVLDYLLGQLDGPRRVQVEREIAADPALADRLAHLARYLDRLLDDGHQAGSSPDPTRPDPPAQAADDLTPPR